MQSGTTGINTLRIYNPIKQEQDHDPNGAFVRHWIPELALGAGSYPKPIVEHTPAVQQARAKLSEFRRRGEVRSEIEQVAQKHGSRKGKPRSAKPHTLKKRQMTLFEGQPDLPSRPKR